jgi:hypothetical protein
VKRWRGGDIVPWKTGGKEVRGGVDRSFDRVDPVVVLF